MFSTWDYNTNIFIFFVLCKQYTKFKFLVLALYLNFLKTTNLGFYIVSACMCTEYLRKRSKWNKIIKITVLVGVSSDSVQV